MCAYEWEVGWGQFTRKKQGKRSKDKYVIILRLVGVGVGVVLEVLH